MVTLVLWIFRIVFLLMACLCMYVWLFSCLGEVSSGDLWVSLFIFVSCFVFLCISLCFVLLNFCFAGVVALWLPMRTL